MQICLTIWGKEQSPRPVPFWKGWKEEAAEFRRRLNEVFYDFTPAIVTVIMATLIVTELYRMPSATSMLVMALAAIAVEFLGRFVPFPNSVSQGGVDWRVRVAALNLAYFPVLLALMLLGKWAVPPFSAR